MLPDSGTAQKEGREAPPPPPPLFCKNKINLAKIYLLHREGGTVFVSDQLSQKLKRAVNLRAYRQNINKLALIMDFFPPPLQMWTVLATKKALQEDWNSKVFFLIFFFRFVSSNFGLKMFVNCLE